MCAAPIVRFRVDFDGQCSVGVGKIELLEGIARTGSLSQAAREMRMSYRRAWLLLEDMNLSFDAPVARASVGGRGGGGVVITAFGQRLIQGYRRFELEIKPLASAHLGEFGRQARPRRAKSAVKAVSIKRPALKEPRRSS
jgi:molybdate transport system regulatory protein